MTATAPHEFNSLSADLILRPASLTNRMDGIGINRPSALLTLCPSHRQIHVHISILTLASPYFSHLLSDAPKNMKCDTEGGSLLPVITFFEKPEDMELLLRFMYPFPDPSSSITSLDKLRNIIDLALKYQFTNVIASLRKVLVSDNFLRRSPVWVYAIACLYKFRNKARLASKATLGLNIRDHTPWCKEFEEIPAEDMYRLLALHRWRARAGKSCFDGWGTRVRRAVPLYLRLYRRLCVGQHPPIHYHHYRPSTRPKPNRKPRTKWLTRQTPGRTRPTQHHWFHKLQRAGHAELDKRPTTETIFNAEFISQNSAVGVECDKCPGFVSSWWVLNGIRERIDALPSMVDFDEV